MRFDAPLRARTTRCKSPPAAAPDPRVPGLALLQCSSWRHSGQHGKYAGTGCYDRGGQHLTGVARVNARLQKWSETDAVPCSHSSSTLQYSSGRLLLSCTRSAALDCPEYVRRRAGLPRPGRHSPDLPPPAACHHGPQRLPLPQAQCWRMRQACRDCHGRGPRIERHGRAAERGAETPRNVSDEAMRQARRWRFAARHA